MKKFLILAVLAIMAVGSANAQIQISEKKSQDGKCRFRQSRICFGISQRRG